MPKISWVSDGENYACLMLWILNSVNWQCKWILWQCWKLIRGFAQVMSYSTAVLWAWLRLSSWQAGTGTGKLALGVPVTAADVYGADVLCALRESPVISAHHHLLIITGPAETHKHTHTNRGAAGLSQWHQRGWPWQRAREISDKEGGTVGNLSIFKGIVQPKTEHRTIYTFNHDIFKSNDQFINLSRFFKILIKWIFFFCHIKHWQPPHSLSLWKSENINLKKKKNTFWVPLKKERNTGLEWHEGE